MSQSGGAIIGIDVKKGMALINNNPKLYTRLLNSFSTNTLMTEFINAIEVGDTATAAAKAHAIKGLAGNLSLTAIAELIVPMEASLKVGTAIPSDDASIASLKDAYHNTLQTIQSINENPGLLA